MAARPRLLPACLKTHEAGKVAQKIEELGEAVAKLRVER